MTICDYGLMYMNFLLTVACSTVLHTSPGHLKGNSYVLIQQIYIDDCARQRFKTYYMHFSAQFAISTADCCKFKTCVVLIS